MSKAYISKLLRERVVQQARWRCGYCLTQEKIVGTPMKIDRIAVLDPETGEMVRLFDPRHQLWREHFVWDASSEQIIGLTAVGRATVIGLHLNRPALVRSRRLWVSAGWHPPND